MSRTRAIMAELRETLAAPTAAGQVPLPRVEAPPARVYTPRPEPTAMAAAAARHTTALVGIGHVGTRYATDVILQFQAELAVAHEAVAAQLADGWAAANGFVEVNSRAKDHREFLLRPDLGRRLDDASLAKVRSQCQRNPDVQLIVADGLSAIACAQTGRILHDAVARACATRGLSVGTPLAARFARVWLEDEIGQEVAAKVAMILLGERPGLGTGDGLSAYVVYGPKVGNTDGDRNMISNIHARGMTPDVAADRLAAMAAAMIQQRRSGVSLDLSALGDSGGRGYRAPQVRPRLVDAGEHRP